MRLALLLVTFLGHGFLIAASSLGQQTDNAAAFHDLADTIASEYSIAADGKPLQLRKESVLTWTNPLVGEIYGGVYVWTLEGRPLAIASIYKWYRPHTHSSHEFQSLTTTKLRGTRDGQKDWVCESPGIEWKTIPDAPTPAATPTQRLVQMRGLAKRFEFEMTEKDDSTTRLRLLSQPLLRYSDDKSDVTDGSLFAFAQATDPEALLLIQANRDGEKLIWYYAITRSNFLAMKARYNGQPIWDAPQLSDPEIYGARGPYAKFAFKTP
ncbi:MAG: hypothetical protein KDB00_02635 [Planctomycetales bacterium]|nr:hypothetical protein [Planctomycetales bacterium]